MKMKFRYLVNSAMLWTALALGSCADFLDREPYSEPVDESYWNSEEDVEAAVAGGYGLLRAALANHSAYYAYGDIAGTNVFSKFEYEDEDWNQMNQFKLDYAIAASETDRPLKQLRNYQLFYRVVNQCNRALKKVGQMSDEVFDDGGEGKEKYIGELYFLRGYTYFYMYRIWGELPIVTTSPDDVINADYVARSPLADVAALIYSDLEEARVRLPWEYEDNANFAVRANKGVVFATLAHMAAWDRDYAKCVAACDSVLNSGVYTFEARETLENIYKNDSKELIFQLFFNSEEEAPDASSDIQYTTVFFLDILASPYLTTAINKEKPNKFLNTGFISSVFPDSTDYRRKTFIGFAAGGDIIPIKYTDVQIESASSGSIYPANNYVIFRLSDIMLLKAEALTAQGKSSGVAIGLLNQIRERADIGDFDGSVSLQRAILNERARELFLEGHRFFDLVRYYYETGTSLLYNVTEANMAKGIHYWPLDPDLFENNSVTRQTSYWQGKI